jgi:UPF0716 protein FxsA
MPVLLVVLFVVVPLVELVVIIQVAELISTGRRSRCSSPTASSGRGCCAARAAGVGAVPAALEQMRWPGDEVTQGALVIVGGTLLLTPGFVTDVVGFLLLLPPTRAVLSRVLRARLTPVPIQGVQQAARGKRAQRHLAQRRVRTARSSTSRSWRSVGTTPPSGRDDPGAEADGNADDRGTAVPTAGRRATTAPATAPPRLRPDAVGRP